MIQSGAASAIDARRLAMGLTGLVLLGGLWLALQVGGGLIAIGLTGLTLGWAYSAPPLRLMTRGLGELAVALAWWLVVIGADYSQRGQWQLIPLVCAIPFALLVASILLVNTLPDAPWDARVGKHTLAVRWGPLGVAASYSILVLLAHGVLVVALVGLIAPSTAWWGLLSFPVSLTAAMLLWRHVVRGGPVQALRPVIGLTIAAALVHALALSGAFAAVAWQR